MAEEVKKSAGRPKVKADETVVENNDTNVDVMQMLKQMQDELNKLKRENESLKTNNNTVVPSQPFIINQTSDANRTVRVISLLPNVLNLTTERFGRGLSNRPYTFKGYGEAKSIPFTDMQKIISHTENRFVDGEVILDSKEDYEALQIGYIHDRVLSKDKLDSVIKLSKDEDVDIILKMSNNMKEAIAMMIAKNIFNKTVSYDFNKIEELKDNGIQIEEALEILKIRDANEE